MTIKITGILLLTSALTFAERIDGPANIRQQINGEPIVSLGDNVEVDLGELKDNWYSIVISVRITKAQFETEIIKKGEKLFDGKGQEIGAALKDLKLSGKSSGGSWYGVDIYGYTFKGNIKPESIVEPVISNLIESNKPNLTLPVFREHMDYFDYVDGLRIKDLNQYDTYMIYESILEDISPLDRVRLIFEDDILIAVVHSRELTITNYETVPIERGRKLTLIKDFSPEDKKEFIEKNKQTYWGID